MFSIREISKEIAGPFIERWHYSGVTPTGKNIFFGWYVGEEELYAVADYGIGVNPYLAPFLAKITGESVSKDNLLELKRLARSEPAKSDYPLSMFLSRCHKKLKKRGYKYVVAFSDPYHNHTGGIYRASNFKHVGKTNPERHTVDKNGKRRHRRYYYRYAKRNNVSMEEARQALGLTSIKTEPKDRFFIRIG